RFRIDMARRRTSSHHFGVLVIKCCSPCHLRARPRGANSRSFSSKEKFPTRRSRSGTARRETRDYQSECAAAHLGRRLEQGAQHEKLKNSVRLPSISG